MKVIKQCIGIDCSKDELSVCFGQLTEEFEVVHKATTVFANTPHGFKSLVAWSKKKMDEQAPLNFVVEATGVYHERLAHFLFDQQCRISIVLPSKAKYFAQTLRLKTVNDKIASQTLATLGLEKQLDAWQKPDAVFAQLKQLTREREQLQNEWTQCNNQLHAEKHSAVVQSSTVKRIKKRMTLIEKQIHEIEKEIELIIESKPELKQRILNLRSIKGIGFITAVTIVGETDGFNLMRNRKQVVSYAGYDVIEKQSGSSVRSKPRMSRKGNKHIRKALHFPAFTAVKHDPKLKTFYDRLYQKHGIKMKAYTAVQRKLLVLMYTLWKNDTAYDAQFENTKQQKYLEQPVTAALTELDHVRS